MYKLIQNNSNIISFADNFMIDKDCYLYDLNSNNKLHLDSYVKVDKINNLIIRDDLNRGKELKSTNLSELREFPFRINCIVKNYVGFYKCGNERLNGVYSLVDNQFLFKTKEYIGNVILDKYVISNINNLVIIRSLFEGRVLFELLVSSYKGFKASRTDTELKSIEVRKFIGIYDNNLWCILNNGFLLAIDIKNGKESNYIGVSKENQSELELLNDFGHAYISQSYKLDEKNRKIILLDGTSYFEIDLKSESPIKKWVDLSEELSKYNIRCAMRANDGFQFDDENFYFYDADKGVVAIMERESLSIVWTYEFDIKIEDKYAMSILQNLKISNDKIYVHDRNNTLHIFEKE